MNNEINQELLEACKQVIQFIDETGCIPTDINPIRAVVARAEPVDDENQLELTEARQ